MNKKVLGKHWYNNGFKEGYFESCPEEWIKGRLPVKDSTRLKHIQNNGMKKLSEEEKIKRSNKLKEYHQNLSLEQKQNISKNISKNRKGKGLGKEPWNKGVQGKQLAWNKGLKTSQETKDKISETKLSKSDLEKSIISDRISSSMKGHIPWNKGKILGSWDDKRIDNFLIKQNKTKFKNNSFNTSSPENAFKLYLEEKYGKNDIIPQYSDDRYPFACDFYIRSLDLFVELNITWTHGGKRFEKSEEDILLLNHWKEKAKTSKYYKNAIYTWTDLDVRKYNKAIENNLNYLVFYNLQEAYERV